MLYTCWTHMMNDWMNFVGFIVLYSTLKRYLNVQNRHTFEDVYVEGRKTKVQDGADSSWVDD